MQLELQLGKTLQENAASYFEKAKKAKKKLSGLQKAIIDVEKKIEKAKQKETTKKAVLEPKKKREKKWFEKFHWFYTSDGFLAVAGRDTKSNEVLVKKQMEKEDKYFHADIFGAPHTVLKTEKKTVSKQAMLEAAQFAAIFSRAWKQKIASADVFSVNPDQVSKSAPSGESVGTGAFMIYGTREWFKKTPLEFAIGINKDGRIISGPKSAVLKHAEHYLEISQGDDSSGTASKQIKKIFEEKTDHKVDLDEIIAMLPAGGVKIKR